MTNISWTDETWNPIAGCTAVSPGCANCYAARMAFRLEKMGIDKYAGTTRLSGGRPVWTGRVLLDANMLIRPLGWKTPRKVFVNSMSDLFHELISAEDIAAVFGVMAAAADHTFQVLSKRSLNMRAWFEWHRHEVNVRELEWERWRVCEDEAVEYIHGLPASGALSCWPLRNVWLGVSVENADYMHRIDDLRNTPAAVKFLSLEPLLGPLPNLNLGGIHQVIVGGESGPGHRPMNIEWLEDIRDQCLAAGVALFVKQDSGPKPGKQGRIPDDLWAYKQMPDIDGPQQEMARINRARAAARASLGG